jgi:2-amino-4-hydroxy-6-hydroxymethyldihydropteridine diphosphokinase
MSTRAFIGLGANLGDARSTIGHAIETLEHNPKIQLLRIAPLYGSDPVDATGPTFINTVVEIRSALEPIELLNMLQTIEQAHGRERPFRNAPRTLDLDLLWMDGVSMDTPRLTLPHPRMHQRAFVLKPLGDLAPDLQLPQGSLQELLGRHNDQKLWSLD